MGVLWDRQYGPVSGAASVANQIPLNTQGNQPGVLPALQVVTATSETLIVAPINPAVALSVTLGPDTQIEQTPFEVNISGYIKTTASGTVTLKLYEGTAIVSGNLLKSSGAVTQNAATAAFYIQAKLMFDSISGNLVGSVKFYINEGIVAETTLTNFVNGPFLNAGNPGANPPTVALLPTFCFSITSSGAGSGTATTINVQKFSCG